MAKGLIGKKIGMSQVFDSEGKLVPVTVIQLGPCFVSQIKTSEKDGYSAVQLAFGETKPHRISKPERVHLEKNGLQPLQTLKEFRDFGDVSAPGTSISASDVFGANDTVKVTGVSKGKGFQGVVKRHGFGGGPETHGSRFQRHPGSIGSNSTPSRVFKGLKMAGRMGSDIVTTRNLKIVRILPEDNLVLVSGSVPGSDNSIVSVEILKKAN